MKIDIYSKCIVYINMVHQSMAQIRAASRSRVAASRKKGKFVTTKQVKQIVNRFITTDLDNNVQTAVNIAFDTTAANLVFQLTSVATGEGIKDEIMRIDSRVILTNPASAGAVICRLIYFQWFPDSATAGAPVPEDIITDFQTVDSILSPIVSQIAKAGRFKVLRDMHITLGEAASVEGRNLAFRHVKIFPKSLARKFIMGTSAGQGFNQVFVMGISNVADASSPPTLTMVTGFRSKTKRL